MKWVIIINLKWGAFLCPIIPLNAHFWPQLHHDLEKDLRSLEWHSLLNVRHSSSALYSRFQPLPYYLLLLTNAYSWPQLHHDLQFFCVQDQKHAKEKELIPELSLLPNHSHPEAVNIIVVFSFIILEWMVFCLSAYSLWVTMRRWRSCTHMAANQVDTVCVCMCVCVCACVCTCASVCVCVCVCTCTCMCMGGRLWSTLCTIIVS